jgi:hypothetical protein
VQDDGEAPTPSKHTATKTNENKTRHLQKWMRASHGMQLRGQSQRECATNSTRDQVCNGKKQAMGKTYEEEDTCHRRRRIHVCNGKKQAMGKTSVKIFQTY